MERGDAQGTVGIGIGCLGGKDGQRMAEWGLKIGGQNSCKKRDVDLGWLGWP